MNAITNTEHYTLTVQPGTRNHKGCFVQDTAYKFIKLSQSGWAFICMDDRSCHYVDPENLIESVDRPGFKPTEIE